MRPFLTLIYERQPEQPFQSQHRNRGVDFPSGALWKTSLPMRGVPGVDPSSVTIPHAPSNLARGPQPPSSRRLQAAEAYLEPMVCSRRHCNERSHRSEELPQRSPHTTAKSGPPTVSRESPRKTMKTQGNQSIANNQYGGGGAHAKQ